MGILFLATLTLACQIKRQLELKEIIRSLEKKLPKIEQTLEVVSMGTPTLKLTLPLNVP